MLNQVSPTIINALVQSLGDGVVMFDPQKQVLLANPAATRFTGLPSEGYNLAELFVLFANVSLEKMVNEALSMQKVTHVQEANVAQFIYDIIVVPVNDETNTSVGGAVILRDVTAQKKAEKQALERSREIEAMNKFMLDRELRMIELKNEIKRLKQNTVAS